MATHPFSTSQAPSSEIRPLGQSTTAPKQIWAIGGGKGGIGKTLVIANMAVYLTWLGKKVVAVDMDFGGANLHTGLGVTQPRGGLSDLILGQVEDAQSLVQPTHTPHLGLISGALDPMGIASMSYTHSSHVLKKLRALDADIVLLDLGAGTSLSTLDYFLIADKKLVVATPEPTSIENAYRFIKSTFFRAMRAYTPSPQSRQLIERSMDDRQIQSPGALLERVVQLSPQDGLALREKMDHFELSLLLNQVRLPRETELGPSMAYICRQYFGIQMNYLGYLPYDPSVWQSVRNKKPFIVDHPHSQVVNNLEHVIGKLLS